MRFPVSAWATVTAYVVGLIFLVAYLVLSGDDRISLVWAFGYVAIAAVIVVIFGGLKLHERFPKLDRFSLYRTSNTPANWWSLPPAKAALLTPAEDGIVCIPVIVAGSGVAPSIAGGILFGLLHLGRHTFLDCIGKAVMYGAVCFFVLPHGVLTVVLGHFATNGLAFVAMRFAKRKLAAELPSDKT